MEYYNKLQKAVSPVIGVILLVALVVGLVALASVFFLSIGEDINETVDASLQHSETDSEIEFSVIENNNVDEFIVQYETEENGEEVTIIDGDVGSTESIPEEGDTIPDGTDVTVVASLEGGNEEVIITETTDDNVTVVSDPDGTATGTVSTNPNIEDATVKSLDENGFVVETTQTDENGEYAIPVVEGGSIIVNSNGEDTVDTNDFYAAYERTVTEEDPSEFDFTFNNTYETMVDGETVEVSYEITEETSVEKQIGNVHQLQAMSDDLTGEYKLITDIDASETSSWGDGFEPVGDEFSEFTGVLNGDENEIQDLYIDADANSENYGLFGDTDTAEVRNLQLSGSFNDDVGDWNSSAGLIAGYANSSTFDNITITGIDIDLAENPEDFEGYVSGNLGGVVGESETGNLFEDIVIDDKIMIDTGEETLEREIIDSEFAGVTTGGDNMTVRNITINRDIIIKGESKSEIIGGETAGVIADTRGDNLFDNISMRGNFTIEGESEDEIVDDVTAGVIADPSSGSIFDNVSMNGDLKIKGTSEDDRFIDDVTAGVIADPNSGNIFDNISMNGDFTIDGTSKDQFINNETSGVISRPGSGTTFIDISMNGNFTIEGESEDDRFIDDHTAGVISDPSTSSDFDNISMNGDFTITGESNREFIDNPTAGVIADPDSDNMFEDISMNGMFILDGRSENDVFIDGRTAGVISRPDVENTFENINMDGDIIITGKSEEEFINSETAGVISNPRDDNDFKNISMDGNVEFTGDISDGEDSFIRDTIGGVIADPSTSSDFENISMNGDLIVSTGDETDIDSDQFYGDTIPDAPIAGLISDIDNESGDTSKIRGDMLFDRNVIIEEEPQNGGSIIAGLISHSDDSIEFDESVSFTLIGTFEVGGEEITVEEDEQIAAGIAETVEDNLNITIENK